jgi:DNA mismatch repair protein MutS
VEDPKYAKGIVKRDIIRVITPGTVIENNILDEKKNNYIASIYNQGEKIGIAYSDVSTGDFILTTLENKNLDVLLDEFSRYSPTEIICTSDFLKNESVIKKLKKEFNLIVTDLNDWTFEKEFCENRLKNHFNVFSLNSFGIENAVEAVIAGGALLEYLYQTQKTNLMHINNIRFLNRLEYMVLDNSARRNLELTETLRDKKRVGSLLWVIDKTNTSMGARMLRSWLEQPLIDSNKINYRLDAVEEMFSDISLRENLKTSLNNIYDIERICSKISYGTVNPKDMIALKNSLIQLPHIKDLLKNCKSKYIIDIYNSIDILEDVKDLIEKSIEDDPPFTLKDGRVIKLGYNAEVDEYRNATLNGKEWLADVEEKEKINTNIKNLKVSFNKVFGYFIEVSKGNLNLVPDRYIRKQTLSNCERFITPELKEIEEKILGAEEKLITLEYNIFVNIREQVEKNVLRLQNSSKKIAEIDCIYSLAEIAFSNRYNRPEVSDDQTIDIKNGKPSFLIM